MKYEYLFESERLGFTNWQDAFIPQMSAINANVMAMKYFPSLASRKDTMGFITKMQAGHRERGYCYFPVLLKPNGTFIGFIGLHYQTFESEFTPCVDIGWRLDPTYWGKGYATEGAKRCLQFAFEDLGLKKVKAIAPEINLPSIKVMEKIGMQYVKTFDHPKLLDNEKLKRCVLYEIIAGITNQKVGVI